MRTQAHRIVDTDPKRGNVVVRVTGTRHDEPTYQVRQSLPNTQEVPGHDHHTNRVRETGSGSHGPILRSVPTNRLSQHLDRSSGSRQEVSGVDPGDKVQLCSVKPERPRLSRSARKLLRPVTGPFCGGWAWPGS